MKAKHIILRSSGSATRDPFMGRFAMPGRAELEFPALTVEVDEIEKSRISDLSRSAEIVAIAPSMPMKLIAPVDVEGAAAPATQTITWGVKAVGADTSPFSGDGVVAAVLDTGIDASHPAFSGVELVQKDFTGEGDGDREGHGTHCAGTIFGRDVNGTRIGVAPGIQKALIGKVLGGEGGSSDLICNAILWAIDNGANVVSMSLGIDFPGYVKELERRGLPTELAVSSALEGYRTNTQLFATLASFVEARTAFSQAAVIVAAAGNESRRGINPNWEVGVAPPAIAEGIISVAALGEGSGGLVVAPFSNTGANVSGPGVNVLSAKTGGGLVSFSGTSMATPHVAGLIALWAEKIKRSGRFSSLELTSRVIGSAITSSLKSGFDPFDVGAGLVRAPQE
ncbi:MAG: S8 family serine peptidase [Leptolyngbyaceae cyanobacterium RU_5_1]|nr:S8 family serine peptidase [Leptolyngbyaceae cyanobacterium RU_5_1]